jgi:hypothetical protein
MERAREARLGLAADLRDIQQVGGRLIRASEKRLKSSALVLGAIVLGGVFIGLAVAATARRASPRMISRDGGGGSVIRGVLGKALAAVGARIATQVITRLTTQPAHTQVSNEV